MSAQGRPYIVVSSRGRFEATDSTLSDLGVQPTGTDKGDPGISFNTDQHRGAGAHAAAAQHHRRGAVEVQATSSSRASPRPSRGRTACSCRATSARRMTDIKAERNGGNGVTVTGESSDREIHNITTSGQPLLRRGRGRPEQAAGQQHQRDR